MARTIASNPFANNKAKERQLEAKLRKLEGRYDKDTAHLRTYREDINDIKELLSTGKIDKDHAEIWASKANSRYEQAEQKYQDKREAIRKANSPNPFYDPNNQIRPPFYDIIYPFFKRLFGEK